ncbi:hypothetical protein TWF751_007317 [Orbilia oligospora]|nr:hypothetical protein TWF751_007317 [Orbilia oligospora]
MRCNTTRIWVILLISLQYSTAVKLEIPHRRRDLTTATITDITTHHWTYTQSCGSTVTAGGGSNGGGGTNSGGSDGASSNDGGSTNGSNGSGTGTGGTGTGSANPTGSGSGGSTGTGSNPTATGSEGTTGTGTSPPTTITSSPSTTTAATERFRLVVTAEDGSLSYVAVNSANYAVVTDTPPPYYYKFDESGAVRQLSSDPKILYGVITSNRKRGLWKRQSSVGYIGGASTVPAGAVGNFTINLLDENGDYFEIGMEVSGVLVDFATNCTLRNSEPAEALAIVLGLMPSDLNCIRLRLGGFRPNVNPSTVGSSGGTGTGTGTRTGTGTDTDTRTGTGTGTITGTSTGTGTGTGGTNTGTSATTCKTPIPGNIDLECRGSSSSTGHAANGREFLLCQGEARLSSSTIRAVNIPYPICVYLCGNELQCEGFIYDTSQNKCFLLSSVSGNAVIRLSYFMGIIKCNDLTPATTSADPSSSSDDGGSSASESESSSESPSQSDSSSTSPSATPVPKCYNFIEDNNDWSCSQGATAAISSTVIATSSATVAYAAALCYNTAGASLPTSQAVTDCLDDCIGLGAEKCKMFKVNKAGECDKLDTVNNLYWDEPQKDVDNLVGAMVCDDSGSPNVCWKPITATSTYTCPNDYAIQVRTGEGTQAIEVCLPPAYDPSTSANTITTCARQCFNDINCIGFSSNPDENRPCVVYVLDEEIDEALSAIKTGAGNLPNYVIAYVRCKDRESLADCNNLGNYAWERCETFASIVFEELDDGRTVRMCKYQSRGMITVYSTITASTAIICAEYCSLLENCDVFNWNKATLSCNVGTGLNAATTAQVDMNLVSGWMLCTGRTEHACVNANAMASRGCDTGSTTGFGYAQDNRSFRICTKSQYTGRTLISQTNLLKSVTQCAYYCTVQSSGCIYFTWDSSASICYIYSNFGTQNTNAPAGTMIGWTLCDDNKPGVCDSGYEANRLATRLCPDNTEVLMQTRGAGSFGYYRVCRDSVLTGMLVPGALDTTVTLFRTCEEFCEDTSQCLFWEMTINDPDDIRGPCKVYNRPGNTITRDATAPGLLNVGFPLCVPIEGDTSQDPNCADPAPYSSLRCFGSYGDMIVPMLDTGPGGQLYRSCYNQGNTMAANGNTLNPIKSLTAISDPIQCISKCEVVSGCESFIWREDLTCVMYGPSSMGTPFTDDGVTQGWAICDTLSNPLLCANLRAGNANFECGLGQYFEHLGLLSGESFTLCGPGSGVANLALNRINTIVVIADSAYEAIDICASYCNLSRVSSNIALVCSFWTLDSTLTCAIYNKFTGNQWTDATGEYSGYPVCDTSSLMGCEYPKIATNIGQTCKSGSTELDISNGKRTGIQCAGQGHNKLNGETFLGYQLLDDCRNACLDDPLCSGYMWRAGGDIGTQEECYQVAIFSGGFSNAFISNGWTVGYILCSEASV